MANNFGPLSTGRSQYSSISQSFSSEIWNSSWQARGTSRNGNEVEAEYKMCMPTGGPAHFHMLLDASGSTYEKVKIGDKRRVYEHLFQNFAELVTKGDTFRPQDMIYVWSFNKRTRLLCYVECNGFYRKLEFIRKEYEKEFDGDDYRETRLYDAVGEVMDNIKHTQKVQPKADYFLVLYTDGCDNESKVVSLSGMMNKINSFAGRLHTFFITVNMPTSLELYQRLLAQQNEITHHNCGNAGPGEITLAFNRLRGMIKTSLVVVVSGKEWQYETRMADYGRDEEDVTNRMGEQVTAMMQLIVGWESGWESLRRLPGSY